MLSSSSIFTYTKFIVHTYALNSLPNGGGGVFTLQSIKTSKVPMYCIFMIPRAIEFKLDPVLRPMAKNIDLLLINWQLTIGLGWRDVSISSLNRSKSKSKSKSKLPCHAIGPLDSPETALES